MIRTSALPNGLQVVTESMADVGSVALSFWVGTGSRDESPAEWGMSHFLEHLLFKGSKTRSALDIAKAIDAVGGDMNAFTTKECTAFYVRVLAEELPMALDILCDIMCEPAFDAKEIEAERNVVLEEILMRGDEPADMVHDNFETAVYDGHTLGREILGDEDNITTMAGADIETFFRKHYRPQNMVFAAAGQVQHDQILTHLTEYFAGREGGERPVRTAPPFTTVRQVQWRQTDQAHLVMGVEAPSRHDPRRYAGSVLDVLLGGGMSSRLFQEIREKRGLAYSVYSSFTPYGDSGSFSVYVGSAPKRLAEAEAVVRAELVRVATDGVTEEEVSLAKRHLRATSALSLEDSGSRMSRIGRSLLLHGNVLTSAQVAERIDAVTLEQVNELARDLFADVEPAVVAIGPIDDALRPTKRPGKVAS